MEEIGLVFVSREQKMDTIKTLSFLKKEFENEGFLIKGVFGSYARGDFNEKSDIDILYDLDKTFFDKYQGFIGFSRIEEIKKELSQKLHKKVDLAPIDNLSKTGKKYILKDVVDV